MPPTKKVDYAKLLKAVESGKSQNEIIKAFKFNTSTQLKHHYLKALMEAGKVPEIPPNRAAANTSPATDIAIGKRGSLVIAKALIDKMGFAAGDRFLVRKTKSGISLKKID